MAAATAHQLGVEPGDAVDIRRGGTTITLPAFVLPGMPDDVVAIALGWGRQVSDDDPVGINAFGLVGSNGPAAVTRGTGKPGIITMQEFHATEGRDLLHEVDLAEWPGPSPTPAEQPTHQQKREEPEEAR